MKDRNLPKSLHTVTVLVTVAREASCRDAIKADFPAAAVEYAASVLGLDTMPDAYGLKAQAVAKLMKGDV